MSHPVFLTSSTFSHMPLGSQNQWQDFFQTASFELEANAFIPILWFMLFKQDNLHWAKYIEDLDFNDIHHQNDFEEYQQECADEHYAYLVIDRQQALVNLAQQKSVFIEIFGAENVGYFTDFQAMIEQHYPQYILLRTNGLPLDPDDAEFLLHPLQQLENYRLNTAQNSDFAEFQRQDFARFEDHCYFFYGETPQIVLESKLKDQTDPFENSESFTSMTTQDTQSSSLAIWLCTAIVVLATLAVYFSSHSVLYSAIVFFVSAFVLGFISSKIGPHK